MDWGAFTIRDPKGHTRLLRELGDHLRENTLSPAAPQCYALERAGDALNDLSLRRVVGKAVLLCHEG